jgi:gamma-glutamylcyclotransferase (GGCT)/AIG2-like uncharacterized protein YtfP
VSSVLLFVYGTLRREETNHFVLRGAECVSGESWTVGTLVDTGSGYPALVLKGDGTVTGELYRVDWDQYGAALDRLEGYYGSGDPRNEYERVQIGVTAESGQGETAWSYIYSAEQAADCIPIPSGDWVSVSRKRML